MPDLERKLNINGFDGAQHINKGVKVMYPVATNNTSWIVRSSLLGDTRGLECFARPALLQ